MLDADSLVLQRAESPAHLAAAITSLQDLRSSLASDVEFWTAVQESRWAAEIAAVFHVAAPA
eukprot:1446943-Rhodomonas_salina.1